MLNIHRQVGHCLGAVHYHHRPVGVRQLGDFPNRIDRPQNVTHMGQGDDPGARADEPAERPSFKLAMLVHGKGPDDRAGLLRDQLPGHQI
jgi:hypothetical protein